MEYVGKRLSKTAISPLSLSQRSGVSAPPCVLVDVFLTPGLIMLQSIKLVFIVFQKELDTKHDKYERLVKISRDITIESKRTIFLLHRVTRYSNCTI